MTSVFVLITSANSARRARRQLHAVEHRVGWRLRRIESAIGNPPHFVTRSSCCTRDAAELFHLENRDAGDRGPAPRFWNPAVAAACPLPPAPAPAAPAPPAPTAPAPAAPGSATGGRVTAGAASTAASAAAPPQEPHIQPAAAARRPDRSCRWADHTGIRSRDRASTGSC